MLQGSRRNLVAVSIIVMVCVPFWGLTIIWHHFWLCSSPIYIGTKQRLELILRHQGALETPSSRPLSRCELASRRPRVICYLPRAQITRIQCCAAVRSTKSAALRAVYAVRRSTAVCCGELHCVVETRSGVNRTLSLRAFQFIKARFFAHCGQQFFPALFQREILINQQCMLTNNDYTYL